MPFFAVFVDLDGTLLDESYSFLDAKEALRLLKEKGAVVVPVSSKSYLETKTWSERIGSIEVFSYEGGFGIGTKRDSVFLKMITLEAEKVGYLKTEIRNDILFEFDKGKVEKRIKGFFYRFDLRPRFISDMSTDEIIRITGLSKKDAVLARDRRGPSPFLIREETKEIIKRLAEKNGLFVSQGRFFMILAPFHKGIPTKVIKNAFKKVKEKILTLGFGDSPADTYLLREVDHPFWVKGPKDLNKKILDFFEEV